MFKFKPYKDFFFNIAALIAEVGVLLDLGLSANFIYYNPQIMNKTSMSFLSYAWGGVIEVVLILNIILCFTYYAKRKPPVYEYELKIDAA